jgi:DNA mismatch repair protein PMS2
MARAFLQMITTLLVRFPVLGIACSLPETRMAALKHHTSKLATYADLTLLQTFGFRGEALSSLCALCESMVITTATSEDAPVGTILELDRDGIVKNKSGKIARQVRHIGQDYESCL